MELKFLLKNLENIYNLPTTLKEIIVEKEEYLEYIKNPFGTNISIKKIEKIIIKQINISIIYLQH